MIREQLCFKDWLKLQEVGTGTNAIAGFHRPIMGTVRRQWPCENKDKDCSLAGRVRPMMFGSWK